MGQESAIPEEREGLLYVPGLKEPLQRDDLRRIHVEVMDLTSIRYFSQEDGRTIVRPFLKGLARLVNCTIGVAGEAAVHRELSFTCHPNSPNDAALEWNISFGFLEADYEIGNEDDWFVEARIPTAIFDELAVALKLDQVTKLKFDCRTDLWTDEVSRYAPLAHKANWKIPVQKYGHGIGRGKIENLSWNLGSSASVKPVAAEVPLSPELPAKKTVTDHTRPSKFLSAAWFLAGLFVAWVLLRR